MNILDKKIKVELNSHGGVVLHIPAHKDNPAFIIYNTCGGKWTCQRGCEVLCEDGVWRATSASDRMYSEQLVDAFWKGMGWGDKVHYNDTIHD